MKKILYLSMIAALWQLSTSANAASCVSVKQTGTNYAAKTVTFVLSWSGCNGTNHLNQVWCFIDWRTVDAVGNKGAWTHATIGTPTVTGGLLSSVNANGFWVTGTNSATVTTTLDNVPEMFDWCAFTSDCENKVQGVTIAGCTNSTICLGEVGFTSTQTWVIGTQTWSAPVTATYCNKTAFNGGSSGTYNSDCRTNPGYAGHLFSWCMVARFKETLCPDGWQVPTVADFCILDKTLNSRSDCSNRTADIVSCDRYLNTWGGQYGGFAYYSGLVYYQGSLACYWSQSEGGSTFGYSLYFDGHVYPRHVGNKDNGSPLRCVR